MPPPTAEPSQVQGKAAATKPSTLPPSTRHRRYAQQKDPDALEVQVSPLLSQPAITSPTRHVTFELDPVISSISTGSHHAISSEPSQIPSFVTPPPPSESGTDSESQSGAEPESCDLTSSGTDSGPVRRCRTKYKVRAVPSPRAQRHINHVQHVGPVGNKHRGKALDVWSFFLPEEGENICVFCRYVVVLSSLHIELIVLIRDLHTTDNNHRIAHFSMRTATGPLHSHLSLHHHDNWIEMCGKLGIAIKSSVAQNATSENSIINDGGYPRRPFSKENFVDALVEFIVGDDMVSVTSNVEVS